MFFVHCDPAVGSLNLGDQIISSAVNRELSLIFDKIQKVTISTQDYPFARSVKILRKSLVNIVGGTNLLTPNRLRYSQWKLGPFSAFLNRFVLMGVGAYSYQSLDFYSRYLYKCALDYRFVHSCRDQHTSTILSDLGFKSINTGCPTMWPLSDVGLQAQIPTHKSDSVIFTLTDYRQCPSLDVRLVKLLLEKYNRVFFWPQGSLDLAYIAKLPVSLDKVSILAPSLTAYESVLSSHSIDYVGTRLHGGIHALNFGKRAIIIGVDNRATEIASTTNLKVVPRTDFEYLISLVSSSWETRITIAMDAVHFWKNQFIPNLSKSLEGFPR